MGLCLRTEACDRGGNDRAFRWRTRHSMVGRDAVVYLGQSKSGFFVETEYIPRKVRFSPGSIRPIFGVVSVNVRWCTVHRGDGSDSFAIKLRIELRMTGEILVRRQYLINRVHK